MRFVSIAVAALALTLMIACVESAPDVLLERVDQYGEVRALPAPALQGSVSIEEALEQRRSVREYSPAAVSAADLGQLFWAAQGVTDPLGHRTAPSAGARYPLEIYAVIDAEVMHYLPDQHLIEVVANLTRDGIASASFGQEWIDSAPIVIVIAGVASRTEQEYGGVAERLMDREAGHVAQNVLLQATALGLGAVPVGGFDPDAVRDILLLPPREEVLYLLPVGHVAQPT